MQKLLHTKESIDKSLAFSIWVLINYIMFSLKMEHMPKHVEENYLMFVLNTNVYLVGIM